MTSKTQEFRILCSRPAGGMRRNPDSTMQDQDQRIVYASGKGATLLARSRAAERAAKEVMACQGWDRFHAKLTIADEEKQAQEYRNEYLAEYYACMATEEVAANGS